MNININGYEKNKNEIIYNNLIENMDCMEVSKDEQIEYLKLKLSNLEADFHNKLMVALLLFLALISLGLGLYLMYIKLYLLGLIFVLASFIGLAYKLVKTAKQNNVIRNRKYDEIERIRSLLGMKLK